MCVVENFKFKYNKQACTRVGVYALVIFDGVSTMEDFKPIIGGICIYVIAVALGLELQDPNFWAEALAVTVAFNI